MGFNYRGGIHILNSRSVCARFRDGHVIGYGIFEFSLRPDGSIAWEVVSSALDDGT
jgi:hypothetical protein